MARSERPPDQAYHMFYVILRRRARATSSSDDLEQAGRPGDLPLRAAALVAGGRADSPTGPRECPVTDDISARLLRLPFYNGLGSHDIDLIVEMFAEATAQTVGYDDA